MGTPFKGPLSRDRAWACVTLNFSLAGLGTLKAGRRISGYMQLVAAFAGFFLCLTWMLKWIYRIFQAQIGDTLSAPPAPWLWMAGVTGFVVSYVWTLCTCVSLMREAKANERKGARNIPPRLVVVKEQPLKLGEGKILTALAAIPNWQLSDGKITRTYEFKDFPAAIKFVETIGAIAEQAWHHPDIDIRWNKVTLTLTTHDAGGLTEKDFALAKQFDQL
jgi:4a-hydroxytetrahydrobiopterin dehydratase